MDRNKAVGISGLLAALVFLLALLLGFDPTGILGELEEMEEITLPPGPPVAVNAPPGEWYELYFTDPGCPPEAQRVNGLDQIIADDMLTAVSSLDIAAFELSSRPITDALIALEARGVALRVVIDADYEDELSVRRLRNAGVSVITDDRGALMHNKFIVIDRRIVWTGSLNYTSNGAFCNNNNAARFDLPALAANYRAEMDEMVDERSFGPTSPLNTPAERLMVGDILLENYFAPERSLSPLLAEAVAGARQEVLFMAFAFTDDAIGAAMLGRARSGITVRGVFETSGATTEFSEYGAMINAGPDNLQVRRDGNPRLMHHKVIIIDRETVVFGSYNFSESANSANDENLVIVHDPEFAGYFVEEFEAVWAEAAP